MNIAILRKPLILVIIATSLCTSMLFAQTVSEKPSLQNQKNTISISLALQDFFDGNGIVHPGGEFQTWRNQVSFGLTFGRRTSSKWGWQASVKTYYAAYNYVPQPLPIGAVHFRNAIFLDGGIRRIFINKPNTEVAGLAELDLRIGDEAIVGGYGRFDVLLDQYLLRDLGINVGVSARQVLFWRLVLYSQIKFTQYILKYDRASQHVERFPNRSTWNMLSGQLGLGICF